MGGSGYWLAGPWLVSHSTRLVLTFLPLWRIKVIIIIIKGGGYSPAIKSQFAIDDDDHADDRVVGWLVGCGGGTQKEFLKRKRRTNEFFYLANRPTN